ncbi:unnamed protein product [Psylliodes chrysocephalus]|uniref:Uncharacterized protein n=1 Tax=Psylliodes chrysocephalus TaxID=3402493 RepID=A0A9P0CVZ8_9CUCU|nr:unnamed protein product [Psylliodes chrysocephala]
MKVLICLFLIVDYIVCEVPPPYPSRIAEPPRTRYGVPNSEQLSQPQAVYGPPKNAEPLDPLFRQPPNPAKFQNPINNINPQNTAFQRPPQRYLGPPRSNAVAVPQTIYGPPKPSHSVPQITYGVPNKQNENNFAAYQPEPSRNYGNPKPTSSIPQTTYGVPGEQISPQNQNNFAAYQPNRQPEPSRNYGTPKPSSSIPQTTYGVPDKQIESQNQNNFAAYQPNGQPQPSRNYGTPKPSSSIPQITYGAPGEQIAPQNQNNFAAYQPNRQPEPSRNYGTPNIDSATLEEIKQLRQLIQKIESQRTAQIIASQASVGDNRHGQSLPNREAGNFRQQSSPVREPDTFKKDISLGFNRQQGARQNDGSNFYLPRENQPVLPTNYIPSQNNNEFNTGSQVPANKPSSPANSWNNLDLPGTNSDVDVQQVEVTQFGPNRKINKNNDFGTTYRPESNNNEGEINNNYIPPTTTENPTINFSSTSTPGNIYETPQDGSGESPNIAIATAVVGAPNDQQYYLLQPDGRYQRIILPKPRDQTNKQIGLPANYQLYQNLQVDPNVLYTPLYTVINK